jgi:hypothetical protein
LVGFKVEGIFEAGDHSDDFSFSFGSGDSCIRKGVLKIDERRRQKVEASRCFATAAWVSSDGEATRAQRQLILHVGLVPLISPMLINNPTCGGSDKSLFSTGEQGLCCIGIYPYSGRVGLG